MGALENKVTAHLGTNGLSKAAGKSCGANVVTGPQPLPLAPWLAFSCQASAEVELPESIVQAY